MITAVSSAPTFPNDKQQVIKKAAGNKKHSVQKLKSDMMQLLIASVKNINPMQQTDPTSSMNMVSTIIALEQGEAQIMAIERLEKAMRQSDNIGNYSQLFGKKMLIKGDKILMQNSEAVLTFKVKPEAKNPVLEIIDTSGEIIFSTAVQNSQTKFTWKGIPGKDLDFYDNLKFRIIEESDERKLDIAEVKAYYTYVDEIIQETEDDKVQRYILTKCGNKVGISEIMALKSEQSAQATSLNTLNSLLDIPISSPDLQQSQNMLNKGIDPKLIYDNVVDEVS